jgi:hypothetical protein
MVGELGKVLFNSVIRKNCLLVKEKRAPALTAKGRFAILSGYSRRSNHAVSPDAALAPDESSDSERVCRQRDSGVQLRLVVLRHD